VSCSLVGALIDMLSADEVQKGKSPFRDRLGEVVADKSVTIIDDGVLRGGMATCAYDSEGVPSATTPLIENGLLKSFLYDSYNAKKGGTQSTGNASKSSYHDRPSISPTNFYLQPGETAAEDLVGSVGKGLYLTEVSGLHAGINPTTADFSVPAKAIIVRDGEFAAAVDNITISGNMLELLRNVELVASDLKWIPGHGVVGAPTMKIGETKVAGR
jgi:PmbA protein